MIYINDHWEQIHDFQDISKIIREYYSYDLANELDKLISENNDEKYFELECELDTAYGEIAVLEDEVYSLENNIEDLRAELKNLNNKNAV